MAGILDGFTSMLSPELVNKASSAFGIDSSHVTRGLAVVGPVLLGGLAKSASTPSGALSLFNALPQDTGSNWLSGILGGSAAHTHAQATQADSIFGAGTNAVGGWLGDKLGFNVRPLLGMAVPLLLGVISKQVKSQGLNATGAADWVRDEHDTFMRNPANKETAGLVFSALAASDKANALRQMFDEAEWAKVRGAPLAALYHVAAASEAGPGALAKEFSAASDAVAEATQTAPAISLIGTAFGSGLLRRDGRNSPRIVPTALRCCATCTRASPSSRARVRPTRRRIAMSCSALRGARPKQPRKAGSSVSAERGSAKPSNARSMTSVPL